MDEAKLQILTEWIVGLCSGVLLGIFGFVNMLNYGGNYGCFSMVDKFFHSAGYESCGLFGAFAGIPIGIILGIIFIKCKRITHYKRVILWSLAVTFFFPFSYGLIVVQEPLTALSVIGTFAGLSFLPSVIVTVFANPKTFFQRKQHVPKS